MDKANYNFSGRHGIGEMFDVPIDVLNNTHYMCSVLEKIMKKHDLHQIGLNKKDFIPMGATIFYLLTESHLSIHTYPEHNALFFDLFICGSKYDTETIFKDIAKSFKAKRYSFYEIKRGATQNIHSNFETADC